MPDDYSNFRDAYDKLTGDKLPNKVPEEYFNVFPNLRKTPKQKARENTQAATPAVADAASSAAKEEEKKDA